MVDSLSNKNPAASMRRGFFRIPALVWALAAVATAAALLPYFLQPVIVDVAPLAWIRLADGSDLNSTAARAQWESPFALADALGAPDHLFEFPGGVGKLRLEFPFIVEIEALNASCLAGGEARPLNVQLLAPGRPAVVAEVPWLHEGHAWHAWLNAKATPSAAIDLDAGPGQPPWIEIEVLNMQPRGVAWLYAFVLTLAFPAAAALIFAFGVAGLGLLRSGDPGIGVVRGLALATAGALVWVLAPRSGAADLLFAAGWAAAGVRGFRLLQESGFRPLVVLAAVFLLVQVETESYALSDGRVAPVDHLHADYGAQRISRGLPMSPLLAARPWLLHVAAAPWDHWFGRFGYWGYVGLVAGLNALSVLVADSILRRLGATDRRRTLAWFVLLPGFVNFHFLGQRLLAGTLAVAAVTWLVERRSASGFGIVLAAGAAFALGIGLHPSIAFIVVTTALLWLVQRRGAWSAFLLGIGLPGVLYAAWLFAMAMYFPSRRNDLLYYPIMKTLDAAYPPEWSLIDILRSLSPGDWATLAAHRLAHLRHYLVTDNWSPAPWTWGRWISLPNVLCWATIPLLIVRRAWRGRETWCVWAILAPLIFHHLFIGQAEPQFHIGPAPFVALMLLAATALADPSTGRLERLLRFLIVAELVVRLLWPIAALKLQAVRMEPTVLKFRILGDELTPYFVLATLPVWCGWRLFRIAAERRSERVCD